jgi:hypothetical protein
VTKPEAWDLFDLEEHLPDSLLVTDQQQSTATQAYLGTLKSKYLSEPCICALIQLQTARLCEICMTLRSFVADNILLLIEPIQPTPRVDRPHYLPATPPQAPCLSLRGIVRRVRDRLQANELDSLPLDASGMSLLESHDGKSDSDLHPAFCEVEAGCRFVYSLGSNPSETRRNGAVENTFWLNRLFFEFGPQIEVWLLR